LEALAAQTYPAERFEVIVVGDGSGASLAQDLGALRARLNLTCFETEHGGPGQARNAGIARAGGELLAFTDDDCAPVADWLERLAQPLAVDPEQIAGGPTRNALPGNLYTNASHVVFDYFFAQQNRDPARPRFLSSNNLAASARGLRAIGGFDVRFTRAAAEDRELCARCADLGLRLTYVPEAVVYHHRELSRSSFLLQQFHYGRGARQLRHLRAERRQPPIGLEPLRFYLGLLLYPWKIERGARALQLATLVAASQAVHGAGFCWEALRGPRTLRGS
jgi:GT2 family glycosyltransferase